MEKSFGNGSMELIKQFEEIIGNQLPNDYVKFLLEENGGFPKARVFHINNKQGNDVLDLFFGLNTVKDYADLFKLYPNSRSSFPSGVFPIAEDPGGNYVCMSLNRDDYGKIYFYDHEEPNEDEQGRPNYNNLYLVANSFSEFLAKMY